MSESSMLDSFKCYICLDYATEAVESDCCHQIGCLICLKPLLAGPCPCCKADQFTYKPSIFVRRLIDDIAVPCANECGEKPRKGEMAKHLKVCEKQAFSCRVEECQFTGVLPEYAVHISTIHRSSMIEKFNETSESESKKCLFPKCAVELDVKTFWEHVEDVHTGALALIEEQYAKSGSRSKLYGKLKSVFGGSETEPGKLICNLNGDPVTMAANGKFYCGKLQKAPSPAIFSGNLVFVGCSQGKDNCGDCMLLDVTFRKLAKAKLVNRNGRVTQTDPCVHKCTFFDHSPMRCSCSHEYCEHDPVFYCSWCSKTNQCQPCKDITYFMEHGNGEPYASIFQ